MKQKIKFFKIIAVFALFSVFYSCHDDELLVEKENISYQIKTSQVSINQVINEISNPEIKESLKGIKQINSLSNSHSNSLLRSSSELFFIKKEKEGLLTTYILNINSYSPQKPYFLKFIITKNLNETERYGYIKYTPTNPTTELDLNTFTGEVQLLNDVLEAYGTTNYINGIKQESNQNNSTNRICNTEIVITEIKCSHSGEHGVGQSCSPGFVNDAYYLVTFFTSCTGKGTEPVQIIEDTGSGNQNGGGSFPASIFLNPFLATLSEEELDIYNANPSIQEYLVKNLVSVPTPNYNPQIGGDPTIIIIKPEAEYFANALIDYAIQNSNANQQLISDIIAQAIDDLNNDEECIILPTVFNPSEIEADYDPNLFGDYPAPSVQQDHDAIQQQFNNLRNTSGNLAAVNYLISTYNMNTFGSNTINMNYSISFADGLLTGDHANAIIGYNPSGNMVTCELQIDTNLFSFQDFGYITRVIKHELYHVLQAENYGQFNVSNAAREFDAYYSQLFGFRNLKKINDIGIEEGIAKKICEYLDQMTESEKNESEQKINTFNFYFLRICNN